jgi:hypothetical protein
MTSLSRIKWSRENQSTPGKTQTERLRDKGIGAPPLHCGTERRFEAQRCKEKKEGAFQLGPNAFHLYPDMNIFPDDDTFLP